MRNPFASPAQPRAAAASTSATAPFSSPGQPMPERAPSPSKAWPFGSSRKLEAPEGSVTTVKGRLSKTDGVKMTLMEEALLHSRGALRYSAQAEHSSLSRDAVLLFSAVVGAGQEEVSRAYLLRHCKNFDESMLELELLELVEWRSNSRGQLTHVSLTWKGKEAFELSRPTPRPDAGVARQAEVVKRAQRKP